MKKSHIIAIVTGTALVLLVPLIAMRFTDEVDWDLTDFVTIGVLLLVTGLAYELVASKLTSSRQRLAVGAALLVLLLYVWAELAVGIFTNLGS